MGGCGSAVKKGDEKIGGGGGVCARGRVECVYTSVRVCVCVVVRVGRGGEVWTRKLCVCVCVWGGWMKLENWWCCWFARLLVAVSLPFQRTNFNVVVVVVEGVLTFLVVSSIYNAAGGLTHPVKRVGSQGNGVEEMGAPEDTKVPVKSTPESIKRLFPALLGPVIKIQKKRYAG